MKFKQDDLIKKNKVNVQMENQKKAELEAKKKIEEEESKVEQQKAYTKQVMKDKSKAEKKENAFVQLDKQTLNMKYPEVNYETKKLKEML
jgi:hypothetical protein